MTSKRTRCEECGTTTLEFDPPIEFELAKACGVLKPGTYAANVTGALPICMKMKHDDTEKHGRLVEYWEEW